MKRILTILAAVFFTAIVLAQSPQTMTYQAVVRNSSNKLVIAGSVGMRISIIKDYTSGTAVYVETQTATSNANGLITIKIGGGAVVSGNFANIDWSSGTYYLKTETDPTGGTNYSITGTSQLLSVPYALYADKAGSGFSGNYNDLTNKPNLADTSKYIDKETDPVFSTSVSKNIKTTDTTRWGKKSNFSGSYSDLTNKPNLSDTIKYLKKETDPIFSASVSKKITSGDTVKWNAKSNFSGSYPDLTNKPSIPDTLKKLILDAGNKTINNIANPVYNCDAVNKAYVTLRVSTTGDTLYLGNGQHIIIPGISAANSNTVVDKDGNVYTLVTIGTQNWMAENLRTTKLNNGSAIVYPGNDNTAWQNDTIGAYAWYNNDVNNKNTYGAIYNWYTVSTGNLCPTGWHVPTNTEWTTLSDYLGGDIIAGGNLKETGTVHWTSPNTGATNENGFTALPGGYRYNNGLFDQLGLYGYFWTSTSGSSGIWNRVLYFNDSGIGSNGGGSPKNIGFSVRCLKNN